MESTGIARWQLFPSLLEHFFRNAVTKTVEIFELMLYSSIYLGCAVAGMAYTCCFLQGLPPSLPIIAVLVGVVFSVYNLNRKTDEAEDALNHEKRFEVTSRLEKPLFISAILSYSIVLIIAAVNSLAATLIALIPLISGILYSVPVLPETWQYHRLKEIPAIKNIVVAGAWGLSFSLIPVFMAGFKPDIVTAIVFMFIFTWTIIGSVLPDIRDREGDEMTGVKTIPVILGIKKTRILLTIFNTFTGIFFIIAGLIFISFAASVILACSVIYSQVCIFMIGTRETDDTLVDIVSDGQFLIIGGITWIIPIVLSLIVLPCIAVQSPFPF